MEISKFIYFERGCYALFVCCLFFSCIVYIAKEIIMCFNCGLMKLGCVPTLWGNEFSGNRMICRDSVLFSWLWAKIIFKKCHCCLVVFELCEISVGNARWGYNLIDDGWKLTENLTETELTSNFQLYWRMSVCVCVIGYGAWATNVYLASMFTNFLLLICRKSLKMLIGSIFFL